MNNLHNGNTHGWDDSIIGMANDIYATFFSEDKFINYRPERKDELIKSFIESSNYLKEFMTGDKEKVMLNRHKLISAYSKAILSSRFFSVDKKIVKEFYNNNPNSSISCHKLFPNEFLVYTFIKTALSACCIESKKNLWVLPDDYDIIFPSLIYHFSEQGISEAIYDENLIRILYFYSQTRRLSKFPLIAFSHVLFLLEMSSDCAFFELKNKYYER